jgi:hypothetical protein
MMDIAETNGKPCVWNERTRGFEEGALQNWIDDGRKRERVKQFLLCVSLFSFSLFTFSFSENVAWGKGGF